MPIITTINMMTLIMIYLVIINIISFIIYGIDKKKAKDKRWRIPESTLIALATVGGSIGSLIAMKTFRHKTRKAKFYIGVPFILIVQIILVIAVVTITNGILV